MWWEGTKRTGTVGKGAWLVPQLPGGGRSSWRAACGRAGMEQGAAQSRMGALCLPCPEVCKEPEGKSPLNHEKNSFSV